MENVCAAFGGREDTLDATRMALIFEALAKFNGLSKQVTQGPECKLAPRWSKPSVSLVFSDRHSCHEGHSADVYGLDSHAVDAAVRLRLTLVRAGVPMPDSDHTSYEYWRDAAARGC